MSDLEHAHLAYDWLTRTKLIADFFFQLRIKFGSLKSKEIWSSARGLISDQRWARCSSDQGRQLLLRYGLVWFGSILILILILLNTYGSTQYSWGTWLGAHLIRVASQQEEGWSVDRGLFRRHTRGKGRPNKGKLWDLIQFTRVLDDRSTQEHQKQFVRKTVGSRIVWLLDLSVSPP